jgi:hypothetical protein
MPNILKIDGNGGELPYLWLDNSGAMPWSDLQSYLPNPTTTPTFPLSNTKGSYALTNKFHVKKDEWVNVAAILATSHRMPYWDFGFALLVQNTTVAKVLFAIRPDGINQIGDMGPNVFLVPVSDGVDFSQISTDVKGVPKDATGIVLNGVDYGSSVDPGNLSIYLSSKCQPPEGDYQILFGMFATEPAVRANSPAGMIVPFFNVTQG